MGGSQLPRRRLTPHEGALEGRPQMRCHSAGSVPPTPTWGAGGGLLAALCLVACAWRPALAGADTKGSLGAGAGESALGAKALSTFQNSSPVDAIAAGLGEDSGSAGLDPEQGPVLGRSKWLLGHGESGRTEGKGVLFMGALGRNGTAEGVRVLLESGLPVPRIKSFGNPLGRRRAEILGQLNAAKLSTQWSAGTASSVYGLLRDPYYKAMKRQQRWRQKWIRFRRRRGRKHRKKLPPKTPASHKHPRKPPPNQPPPSRKPPPLKKPPPPTKAPPPKKPPPGERHPPPAQKPPPVKKPPPPVPPAPVITPPVPCGGSSPCISCSATSQCSVLYSPISIHVVFYGTHSDSHMALMEKFISSLNSSEAGGNPNVTVPYWWNINRWYYDRSARFVSGSIGLGQVFHDSAKSQGALTSFAKVMGVVTNAIDQHGFPLDSTAQYAVITDNTTAVTGSPIDDVLGSTTKFCEDYCGYHSVRTYKGTPINVVLVGHPGLKLCVSLGTCTSAPLAYKPSASPNGNIYTDSQISVLGHEIAEAATDPLLDGWLINGGENADYCYELCLAADPFGCNPTSANALWKVKSANNLYYNMVGLGGTKFLVQPNYDLVNGKCVVETSAPPF